MSGDVLYDQPRRHPVMKTRVHDYLYDSAYIVSGARDYARTAFKAAMASAQLVIQPVYRTMFSEVRQFPRMHIVYHPNCRLPPHIDRSYGAYLSRLNRTHKLPPPDTTGKDRFKFNAVPRRVLELKTTSPNFNPGPCTCQDELLPPKPMNKSTQSVYRESSAQTKPWQPDGKAAEGCEETPEVLYLDKLEWGPGIPYRTGDLPADFHTTEIINKMRHARIWTEVAERGQFPRWMKRRDEIIKDVETKDWIFREAEIDELQEIRLTLLHRLQSQHREKQTNKTAQKLANRWNTNKEVMERKINRIRRARDRELRKLSALHEGGGRLGQVQRMRASRGGGSATVAAHDPTSDVHAPILRHGYQARGRNACITYDPAFLSLEDHKELSKPPVWLEQCGQNLTKTCSGHHLPRDPQKLCERESKWSDQFLENLHNDLKKARLGAVLKSAGPLRVLKPRRLQDTPRPATPEVESVNDMEENHHQAALLIQRIIRGRAVQCLMYEGRTRAAELTEELKTTHGLQKEDKIRIAREETKAREYNALRSEVEQKEDAITALVDELCGGAVSAALDFLEKELRRLKEERRQHAFILIALREKAMREAAEAGRRQKEEHRRREHDEMFKQILGVTQETVESYLRSVIEEGIELGAEAEAVRRAQNEADKIDEIHADTENEMSSSDQNELIAELVQQFLLPNAHKTAARHRIAAQQQAKLDAARRTIFGLLDDAEIKERICTQCGVPLGEICRCRVCPIDMQPTETKHRDDWRWKEARRVPKVVKEVGERYPPEHEFRCMLNTLIDEVAVESRKHLEDKELLRREIDEDLKTRVDVELEARGILDLAIDMATGAISVPVRVVDYRHYSRRIIEEAIERTVPVHKPSCPLELPSAIRQRQEEEKVAAAHGACLCVAHEEIELPGDTTSHSSRVKFGGVETKKTQLLPSELRILEEMRKCKCDTSAAPSPVLEAPISTTTSTYGTGFDIEEKVTEPSVKGDVNGDEKEDDEDED